MSNLYVKPWYPVGMILEFDRPMDMTAIYGGTWELYGAGRMTVGIDTGDTDFNTAGKTSGSKTHTQTVDEMPQHTHKMLGVNEGAPTVPEAYKYPAKIAHDTKENWPLSIYGESFTGGSKPMNIMNPYTVVYRYRKVAY